MMTKNLRNIQRRYVIFFIFVFFVSILFFISISYFSGFNIAEPLVFKFTIFIIFIFSFVSLVGYVFARYFIITPLSKFSKFVEGFLEENENLNPIKEKNLDKKKSVSLYYFDRLFNNASLTQKELKKYADKLEKKVENRTKQMENIGEKLQRYVSILDENVVVIQMDNQGVINNVSSFFCKMTGFKESDILGKFYYEIVDIGSQKKHFTEFLQAIINCPYYQNITKIRKNDGYYFWLEHTITPMLDKKQESIGLICVGKDITHQMKLESALRDLKMVRKQSERDFLTGLYNRGKIDEVLIHQIMLSKKDNEPLCLAIFDIDFFKKINDNHGHLVGDEVLRNLSSFILRRVTSNKGVVGRWGGEEFVIIRRALNLEEAFLRIDKLRQLIGEHSFCDEVEHITISAGIAMYNTNEDGRSLVHRADEALYMAKRSGRNKVVKAED